MHSGVQHLQICLLYSLGPSQRNSFGFDLKGVKQRLPAANDIKTEMSPCLYILQPSEKIWHERNMLEAWIKRQQGGDLRLYKSKY